MWKQLRLYTMLTIGLILFFMLVLLATGTY